MSFRVLCCIAGLILPLASIRADKPPAPPVVIDLLLVNGKIWTGDSTKPEANVIAVNQGRILFVKTNAEMELYQDDLKKLTIRRTVDLGGRRVVPGFYDAHVHFLSSGQLLGQVMLKDAKDEEEFGRRLREQDKKLPRGRWMQGGDWDHDRALNGKLPTAKFIDQFVADRPVFLPRYDGHMAIANTKALQLAGINDKTPEPAGGVIYKDENGKPTGLLRDNAMVLVYRLIPPPDDIEIAEAVQAAMAEARRVGVTSVQDLDGSDAVTRRKLFQLYQRLAREEKLTLRIDFRWPLAQWKDVANLGVEANFGNDYVRIGGVKGFVDGSLGSSTAKFFEPFVNEPNSTGVWVTPRSKLLEYILAADKAGLSVAVHAIGDQANAELLDIFAEVAQKNGPRDRRFRIEHAQHLRPQEFKRFKELNVIASMQPYHAIDDGRWAEGRIGAKRCATSYAFRSLLDAGATLAFGSDWSVAPLSPILGVDAAVNRRTLDGKHPEGWFPEQKITVEESLRAYTYGSACAGFQEHERGTLEPGKFADIVVLSRDILDHAERDNIAKTEVMMTIVGGKIVHEKK
ncbi:MAG TPA: amidohydrolase [Gemmataceae bacterium]|nr:amidohydrolase [Gemmataceae bacterium]